MADMDHFEGRASGVSWQGMQRLLNVAGAMISVVLVGGLGYWGYALAMRDVTAIPVVRALEGPMRIAPADPGGEIASNIGLTVNAIAAEGEEVPPADRLVLAPRPVELTPEDLPAAALPAMPQDLPAAAVPDANPSGILGVIEVAGAPYTPTVPVEVPTETLPPMSDATQMAVDVLPLTDVPSLVAATKGVPEDDLLVAPGDPIELEGLIEPASEAMAEAVAAALAGTPPEPAPPGALVRSPRPLARPSEMVVLAAASATAPASTVAKTVDPAAITPGTRLVQLGAFDNVADAIDEWNRLTARFGGLVADKSRVLQDAISGGRNFVRLRAMGFLDEADARRFCSALLAENAACIPVAQR